MDSWRWVGLAVSACLVVAALAVGGEHAPTAAPAPPDRAAAVPAQDDVSVPRRPLLRRALRVLTDWDARRAAAWGAADADALRQLYVPGSRVAVADLELLRRWQRSGWRVARLDTQLLRVQVLEAAATRLLLRVRDRLAGGVLRRDQEERPLPASRPVTRTLTLVLQDGSWRVARVEAR